MNIMQLKCGEKAIITEILKNGSAYRRLLDFGFTPGTVVTIKNIAPFGGTVLVTLRGYTLAIRENAGVNIIVKPSEQGSI